jgi:hypothetical protein
MGMKLNLKDNSLTFRRRKEVKTVELLNQGVNKMEYELEEVERDYVEFRREMGEEQIEN